MLSSLGQRDDKIRCQKLGIETCLTKPVKQSELLDAIMDTLSGPSQAKEHEPSSADIASNNALNPLHILLAEDNLVNQKLAVRILEKQGQTVVVVGDGKEALAALEKQEFDLVLMDMQMPNLSGYDATTKLRDEGFATPIVALTAHAMKGDDQKCIDAGCNDYLTKPIDRSKLLATIRKYLLCGSENASEAANISA